MPLWVSMSKFVEGTNFERWALFSLHPLESCLLEGQSFAKWLERWCRFTVQSRCAVSLQYTLVPIHKRNDTGVLSRSWLTKRHSCAISLYTLVPIHERNAIGVLFRCFRQSQHIHLPKGTPHINS
jgi:hypothetical protein